MSSGGDDGVLNIQNNGTTAVTVNASGNVGIGTTSPSNKLSVSGGISGTAGLNISGGGWGVLPYVANSLVIDNNSGESRFFAAGADATTDGSFLFYTSQTDGGANERARITSSGNLLVGTTDATSGGNSNGFVFEGSLGAATFRRENGNVQILRRWSTNGSLVSIRNTGNSEVGSISSGASSTTYATSSDYRLKHDIQPMTGALAKVAQLKPVTYKWNADDSQSQGFIAHELQAVVPECVTGEKDAVETYVDEEGVEQTRPVYQGIDTSFLVATLTAAIQELSAKNDALEARLSALEQA
jgi:hypothetical protein